MWWPNPYGAKLYQLRTEWEGEIGDVSTNEIHKIPPKYLKSVKYVNVGFRTVEVVEDELGALTGPTNLF